MDIRKILRIGLPSLAVIGVAGLLLFPMVKMALHLDFSQEYRKIEGADRIRFRDNWSGKVYGRSFWGLRPVGQKKDEASGGYPENAKDSGLSIEQFSQYEVKQVELSPDGRYILYCEIAYGVNGGYSTDEEYCYYRVIDREDGEQYTIYSGYREWYQVYWED
ncbi:MAG: hypothetical protein HDR05_09965 [Lachnospiraceae bacterium]|nr:hypothetical protein [Lachnospiraceae bacterium]